MDRMRRAARIGCPFCFEWIPKPKRVQAVYSPDIDAQTLLCDGDAQAAAALETDVHVKVETRDYTGPGGVRQHAGLTPKVWFVKRIG